MPLSNSDVLQERHEALKKKPRLPPKIAMSTWEELAVALHLR